MVTTAGVPLPGGQQGDRARYDLLDFLGWRHGAKDIVYNETSETRRTKVKSFKSSMTFIGAPGDTRTFQPPVDSVYRYRVENPSVIAVSGRVDEVGNPTASAIPDRKVSLRLYR